MKKWQHLSQEEKNEVVCKAHEWQMKHSAHVRGLIYSARNWTPYAPSASDLWHPELWKTSHWQWFSKGAE